MSIVSSFNLFIDTDRGESTGTSEGDDFNIHLNSVGVQADKGQFLRLTLNSFSMYKNFPNVNVNNSHIRINTFNTGTALSHHSGAVNLTHQNYASTADIASEFASKVAGELQAAVIAHTGVATITANVKLNTTVPAAGTPIAGTTSDIISFTVEFSAAHQFTGANLQFLEEESDSYALLGGDRIKDRTDNQTSSVFVDILTANEVVVTCKYPAQRHTSQFVYLRTDLVSKALETSSLAHTSITGNNVSDVHHSNILGRVLIDTEFVQYDAQTGREYFIDVTQKHLQNVRIYLTDEHNRRLPKWVTPSLTGAVTTSDQAKTGNMSFTAVLRVDTIQQSQPNERFTPDTVRTVPARLSAPMDHF